MRHALRNTMIVVMLGGTVFGAAWTPLFDGETLTGWHRAGYSNGEAPYTVEAGCIVGTTKLQTPSTENFVNDQKRKTKTVSRSPRVICKSKPTGTLLLHFVATYAVPWTTVFKLRGFILGTLPT